MYLKNILDRRLDVKGTIKQNEYGLPILKTVFIVYCLFLFCYTVDYKQNLTYVYSFHGKQTLNTMPNLLIVFVYSDATKYRICLKIAIRCQQL